MTSFLRITFYFSECVCSAEVNDIYESETRYYKNFPVTRIWHSVHPGLHLKDLTLWSCILQSTKPLNWDTASKERKEQITADVSVFGHSVACAAAAVPKHLLRFVCLSMKTLAETTFPKGMNIWSMSWSPNSWGRW